MRNPSRPRTYRMRKLVVKRRELFSPPEHLMPRVKAIKKRLDQVVPPLLADDVHGYRKGRSVLTAIDLIALIRYTLEHEPELVPYATTIEQRYQNWHAQQAQNGVTFTDQQRWWLDRIRDTIIQNATMTTEDLELAPFTEHGGTDGYLNDLGTQAADILNNLTKTLAA